MDASARFGVTSSEIIVRGESLPIVPPPGAAVGRNCPRDLNCDDPITIYIVDDNAEIRTSLRDVLEDSEYTVECFASGADFLEAHRPGRRGCLLVDSIMPGMNGIELIRRLKATGDATPAVVISGHATVMLAVQAMKAGAVDFIEKPFRCDALLASVERALILAQKNTELTDRRRKSAFSIASLTRKQTQILDLVLAGYPSKNIAADLGISQRTVDNHRAAIMRKTGSKSLAALVQTAICAHCIEDQRNDRRASIAASPRPVQAIQHVRPADASHEAASNKAMARGRSLVSLGRPAG